ncbi:unnamed protein product, partial [marine sediment metagenome]
MKPGLKTTEFWMTMAFHASAAALVALGQVDAQWAVAASGIVQAIYSFSRGYAKK